MKWLPQGQRQLLGGRKRTSVQVYRTVRSASNCIIALFQCFLSKGQLLTESQYRVRTQQQKSLKSSRTVVPKH